MAIMQAGILSTTTGKVGGVVGSTWKDKNTLRAYRATIAKSESTAAVNARDTFKKAVNLTTQVSSVLARPLWQRFQKSMSGYNALLSGIREGYSNAGVFTPADCVFCKGRIAAANNFSATNTMGTLSLTWDNEVSGYALDSDIPYVVVLKANGTKAQAFDLTAAGKTREDGAATVEVTEFAVSSGDLVFLMFKRADGTMVSNQSLTQLGV